MGKSINDLVLEYFYNHPNEELYHGPVVDWVEEQYFNLYGRKPRDTWRQIRKLHQTGKLIKIRKGVYKYDPDFVKEIELFEFPNNVKEEIFSEDNYKCVVCGLGRKDGVELCADHRMPKDKGGTNTAENGQTLCAKHNLLKKNYSMTEAGKRYVIKLYKMAVANNDEKMIRFCRDIFDVYDKNDMNGHIKRPNGLKTC
jgi:hypothetical protein